MKSTFSNPHNHKLLDIQKQLKQELLYKSLILQNIAEGICLVSIKEKTIVYINPTFETMFGYEKDELITKPFYILQNAPTEKSADRITNAIIKKINRANTYIYEIENIRKDKTTFWSRVTPSWFNHPQFGDVWVSIYEDITKFKKLEELQKAFLSAAAHELKAPITVLKLLTQAHILKAEKLGLESIPKGELMLIDKELNRLTILINDILDSSRFETGKWYMNFSEVNLSQLIEDTLQKVRLYNENHTIIFNTIPNQVVLADPQRIEQVLINLLSNAIKYSPEKSTITVTIQSEKSEIKILVADQGIGISKEKQHYIFDRYYQVKVKNPIGFGLGLYICKEIIIHHKGTIGVKSKEGKGSTFFFTLPRENNKRRTHNG